MLKETIALALFCEQQKMSTGAKIGTAAGIGTGLVGIRQARKAGDRADDAHYRAGAVGRDAQEGIRNVTRQQDADRDSVNRLGRKLGFEKGIISGDWESRHAKIAAEKGLKGIDFIRRKITDN